MSKSFYKEYITVITFVISIFWDNLLIAQARPDVVLPQMVIEETVFSFGDVPRGEKVSHPFVIKNIGNSNLLIEDIRSDCGCAVAVPDEKTVLPGEKTEVKVTFDTSGFSGSKTRIVRLFTNDPKQPVAFLKLEGSVKAPVLVDPPRLYFGNIERGKTDSRRFRLQLNDKVKVEDVTVDSNLVTVSLVEGDKTKDRVQEYVVTLAENIPPGSFRTSIKVRMSGTSDNYISIPIFAGIREEISSLPEEVSFGLLPGPLTDDVYRDVKIIAGKRIELAEIKAESENGRVEAKVTGIDRDGKSAFLRVSLLSGTFGPIRTKINLSCVGRDGKEMAFSIPVYAIVATKGD